jgi:hypothetical protein
LDECGFLVVDGEDEGEALRLEAIKVVTIERSVSCDLRWRIEGWRDIHALRGGSDEADDEAGCALPDNSSSVIASVSFSSAISEFA